MTDVHPRIFVVASKYLVSFAVGVAQSNFSGMDMLHQGVFEERGVARGTDSSGVTESRFLLLVDGSL